MRRKSAAALFTCMCVLGALIASCATTSETGKAPPTATSEKQLAPDTSRNQSTPTSKPAAKDKLRVLPEPHTDFDTTITADSPEDKCYEDCLKRNQAVAMSWDAIQARCRSSCKKMALAAAPAPPPPPKRPWSKDRTCNSDKDCVVEWDPCSYRNPPCGLVWKRAVNREADRKKRSHWANKVPACNKGIPCRRHPSQWLGSKAVCERGQCSIR